MYLSIYSICSVPNVSTKVNNTFCILRNSVNQRAKKGWVHHLFRMFSADNLIYRGIVTCVERNYKARMQMNIPRYKVYITNHL